MIDEREEAIEDAIRELYQDGRTKIRSRSVWGIARQNSQAVKIPNPGVVGNYLKNNRDLGFAQVVEIEEDADSNLYILE